ncbi:MAG: hemolysin III family protein [Candidatus Moraniibacteriota bacterium]
MSSSPYSNEPVSSFTHLIATLLSIAGLSLLVTLAALSGSATHVVAFAIFGAALILLYLASTLYHFISKNHPAKELFRILDHSMIYVLIAGTYTPITLLILPLGWGWTLFGIIWGLSLIGIVKKVLRPPVPGWFSATFYLLMGWLILIALGPLQERLSNEGLFWLALGGVFYTIGTVFFTLDHRFPLQRWYTLHDIFHVFVMLGSLCHFWFMLKFVLP